VSTDTEAGIEREGGVLSTSVIVTPNVPELVLPLGSDAVHVTVVGPTGNFVPEGGAQPTVAPTASVADGLLKVSTFPRGSVVVSLMGSGIVAETKTGAVVSWTVT
jgi:hypothetical protein